MYSNVDQTPWADTPFALIPIPGLGKPSKSLTPTEYMAQDMANAHNSLLRSLNSIYNQAPFVNSPEDISDLLQYAKFWCQWIDEHHTAEEEFLLPKIEEYTNVPGLMETNVGQHAAFGKGLETWEKYVKEVRAEEYYGKKMQSLIEAFGNIFATHMSDEIDTLLGLASYDKDWRKLNDQFVAVIQKKASVNY
jgi:hemerythrin-like domain-containing protein